MTSQVSICNLALANIGKPEISSISEASAEARACNRFWSQALASLLSSYPWRFATMKTSLAEVTNDRVGEWLRAYARPVGSVKVISVHPNYDDASSAVDIAIEADRPMGLPYDVEGQTIYCDVSPAFLVHVSETSNPTKFPPLFVDALAWHLTTRIAMPLTRDLKQRAEAFKMAQMTQALAEAADANEVRETSETGSEYERSR